MNKIIRIISIVLLGAASAAMFLLWTPLIKGQSVAEFVTSNDWVIYALAGLLGLSAFLCIKAFGLKKKKIMRLLIALIAIGVVIASKKVPNQEIKLGDFAMYLTPLILLNELSILFNIKIAFTIPITTGFVFAYLFVVHMLELFKRRGLAKLFSPLADIVMIVVVALVYIEAVAPIITEAPFYNYIEMAHQYAPYAAGGLLAIEFAFSLLELFIFKDKEAKANAAE